MKTLHQQVEAICFETELTLEQNKMCERTSRARTEGPHWTDSAHKH